MSTTRKRIVACAMSVIMAFSMVSATAMTAFADTLRAGTVSSQSSGDPIVYDNVYGVLNGEYALMMKTVTYEQEYKGEMKTFYATVEDIVKADGSESGEVTVHTSNDYYNRPEVPGEPANYERKTLVNSGRDIMSGYVLVSEKETGKAGLKSVDGSELIACEYDSIRQAIDGDFACIKYEGSDVIVDFLDESGANCGSVSFAVPEEGDYRYTYLAYYGNIVRVTQDVDGQRVTVYVSKSDGRYAIAQDVNNILYGRNYSGSELVLEKNDGYAYYQNGDGELIKLGLCEGANAATINYDIVTLYRDGETPTTTRMVRR